MKGKGKKVILFHYLFAPVYFFIFVFSVLDRQLELCFIAVGQGDSIFLRTPERSASSLMGAVSWVKTLPTGNIPYYPI